MTEAELFSILGRPLGLNPERVLTPIKLPSWKPESGPYHKVQFVIELIGPSLIPHTAAKSILEGAARTSVGDPEIYVMAPGQSRWQALWAGDANIAYDSLAFAWDLVTERGTITEPSANELLRRAERFANTVNRRAAPLPPPRDAASAAKNLAAIKEGLDIGVDILLTPKGGIMAMQDLIPEAYEIGFSLRESGLLEWRIPGWPEPILTLFPAYEGEQFDPRVTPQCGGAAVGFSVPCSPSPLEALDRAFAAADALSERLDAAATDDEGRLLSPSLRTQWVQLLERAVTEIERVGIKPGSAEALRLFMP